MKFLTNNDFYCGHFYRGIDVRTIYKKRATLFFPKGFKSLSLKNISKDLFPDSEMQKGEIDFKLFQKLNKDLNPIVNKQQRMNEPWGLAAKPHRWAGYQASYDSGTARLRHGEHGRGKSSAGCCLPRRPARHRRAPRTAPRRSRRPARLHHTGREPML